MGKTKRGKGSKIMAMVDSNGVPIAIHTSSASPHEVELVRQALASRFTRDLPVRLIADKAYDSDPLDAELAALNVELIAPHKRSRVKPRAQDGRKLRRYRRRWKVERFFAHLQSYRRVLVRQEYLSELYRGMVLLACVLILLKHL